jgi:hypothetical protein
VHAANAALMAGSACFDWAVPILGAVVTTLSQGAVQSFTVGLEQWINMLAMIATKVPTTLGAPSLGWFRVLHVLQH